MKPWIAPHRRLTFDVAPERVTRQAADGRIVDSRTNPRSSYFGNDLYSPWDVLQVSYFLAALDDFRNSLIRAA